MKVEICVGSACYLKGANTIVEQLQQLIKENALENEITLAGNFCVGKCNREGVTVTVDGVIYTGITPESFNTFFKEKILNILNPEA